MSILVTAASGQLGRLVVEALVARGATDVIAGARTPAKAADLGVPVVEVDYDRPETLAAAFADVDTVLFVSASDPGARLHQHRAVVEAATSAGVGHLVYTSATRADTTDLVVAPDHKVTEELIGASGIPFTVLRNNWYTENYVGTARQAATSGELVTSAGDGRVASASRADYADAAAVVLLDPSAHVGAIYELGGDTAWTFDVLAAAIAEVTGRPVALRAVTADEQRAGLEAAGLDAGTAGFVVALDQNIAAGDLDDDSHDLSRLIGRPTTPLVEGLRAALAD